MSDIIDRETVSTPAGEYVVTWYHDTDAYQPEDDGFTLAVADDGGHVRIDVGDTDSGLWEALRAYDCGYWEEVRSGAALVRWLTLRGYKGVTLVSGDYRPVEPSTDRNVRVRGVAWAPADATYPADYVRSMLEEWRAWADGDTFGVVIESPDGTVIESVWGYYGFNREREYTRAEALDVIRTDAEERSYKASLAGAGFVGIV